MRYRDSQAKKHSLFKIIALAVAGLLVYVAFADFQPNTVQVEKTISHAAQ